MTMKNQISSNETGNTAPQGPQVDHEHIRPPHPGAVLKKLIDGINFEVLCVNLATSPTELSLLIEERIRLTARTALRLSRTLVGKNFHEWMKIQNDYDLHLEEQNINSAIHGHSFGLSHLLPADQKNKHGGQKMGKEFRQFITHHLTNQIEENINAQRNQAGLPPWKDRDFEKAFSLGSENDAHAGRQWRRLKSKSEGSTTEDRIKKIKKLAEKNGWLPSTEFNISKDMIKDFLEMQDRHFLDSKKWDICQSIEIFHDALEQCPSQRIVLWGTDIYEIDPEETALDEYSSEDEIHEFLIKKIDEIRNNLEWTEISNHRSQ
ncbi:hypothetical protein BLA39750_06519 [Burkholderia lata]|uniref:Uncharacterized protein n=1 Tax=Burkholderia lata (strain ATCC 17760 / DSM 23089 / LMG 22485 / NCIMB 9086 / R18194 / 383) TaxID=482957 RepID=A0A6P3B366_BURL3|nr:hypothetical protein [Burkholderia lata]VWD54367.1 hypothetical protein BLA39750_06519 [Burkholderia lata]